MAIDLLFVLMAGYGFYFGYTHGILKVLLMTALSIAGLLLAMYLTIPAIELSATIFGVKFRFMPLTAFGLICLFILLTTLLVFRIVKDNSKIADMGKSVKMFAALLMSAIFVFFYSVLLSFFIQANAVDRVKARDNSIVFPYLEQIPTATSDVLKKTLPFVNTFFETVLFENYEKQLKEKQENKDVQEFR